MDAKAKRPVGNPKGMKLSDDPRFKKVKAAIVADIGKDKKAAGKKPSPGPLVVPTSKHLPIPGLEFLGAGYNVFGRYASADEVKANIFDFSKQGSVDQQLYDESLPQVRGNVENAFTTMPTEIKLIYARPPGVQFKPLFHAELDFSEGGSMSSEQHSLAAHLDVEGSYELFSGEFHARYSSSDTRLSTAKFYSATAFIRYYDLSMANFPLHPVEFIRPSVRQDLNNKAITPAQIFDKYGSYYLYAVTIGSKLVYGHTVDTSKTTSSYDASVEIKAKYGEEGAEISGGGGVEVKGSSEQASDAESIKFYAEGISDAQIEASGDADKKPLEMLKEGWHNPTLIDFPTEALKPIWDLCDADDRKQELKNAFDAYAKTHGSVVGASADLVPLYLFATPARAGSYRFLPNRNDAVIDGISWKAASNDGKPALYVYDEQKPNTVPLYEYRVLADPGSPVANMLGQLAHVLTRYETSRWQTYLARYVKFWAKTSGNPIGWVYDGLEPTPKSAKNVNMSQDVYVYRSRTQGAFGFLYSTDSADGRDTGAWRAFAGVADEVPGYAPPPAGETDTVAVVNLGSNVHWRSPTLTAGG